MERGAILSARPTAPSPVYEAAPTPNLDLVPPLGNSTPAGAKVGPEMFTTHVNYRGDGYTPGSTSHASPQPRHMSFPGISVKVPLN